MIRGGALGLYDVNVTTGGTKFTEARLRHLSRCDGVRFIHAHISPASVPEDIPLRRAVTLRRPLDRLLSHFCYCYEHRHADSAQFRFFSRPGYVGRKVFVADDVAEWVRSFRTDNYMTRFLTGRIHGEVSQEDGRAAENELRKMTFIGFTDDLSDVLAQLACALDIESLSAGRANASNRSVAAISPKDGRLLADEFLRVDEVVFEKAKDLASSRQVRFAGRPVTAPQAAGLQDRVLAALFTIRHRTLREWRIAAAARFISTPRRLAERFLLMTSSADHGMREEVASERIDLAAE